MKVRWAGAKQAGSYRGELTVEVAGAKDTAVATLPYTVEVVPAITAYPPSLLIEEPVAGRWSRRVVIESRRDLPGEPSLLWADETVGKSIQARVTKDGTRSVRVELSGKREEGSPETALTVRVGEQAVEVPVRFAPARR